MRDKKTEDRAVREKKDKKCVTLNARPNGATGIRMVGNKEYCKRSNISKPHEIVRRPLRS